MKHIQANGFRVEAKDVTDERVAAVGAESGVPGDLVGCHIARIGNYVVSGHVPADDIKKLLRDKPAVAGLAVPGMPAGSPGMEMGGRRDPYDVFAFTKDGRRTVYVPHR